MDCAQFKEVVHDLDRSGTPGFALRRSALEHADDCGECNAVLSEVELLESALSRIAAEDAEEHAPIRVEAALLTEFRRQATAEMAPRKDFNWAVLGIAASFLLVLGMGLHYWTTQRLHDLQPSGNQVTQNAGQQSGATPADTSGAEFAGDDDLTDATDFISLPYADDPATLQDGTIVRVMLSRSALDSFGLPVVNVGPSDQIPAEIALSEDGAPQAIRLLAGDDLDHGN